MTYVIEKIQHIKQPTRNLCWATCAKMLYQHKKRPVPPAIVNPPDQKQLFSLERFARDAGLTCTQLTALQFSANTIEPLLRQHGPLIATVGWYSKSPHIPDHALLIVGVDAQHVFIDNPASEKGEAKSRIRISEIKAILGVWPCRVMYLQS